MPCPTVSALILYTKEIANSNSNKWWRSVISDLAVVDTHELAGIDNPVPLAEALAELVRQAHTSRAPQSVIDGRRLPILRAVFETAAYLPDRSDESLCSAFINLSTREWHQETSSTEIALIWGALHLYSGRYSAPAIRRGCEMLTQSLLESTQEDPASLLGTIEYISPALVQPYLFCITENLAIIALRELYRVLMDVSINVQHTIAVAMTAQIPPRSDPLTAAVIQANLKAPQVMSGTFQPDILYLIFVEVCVTLPASAKQLHNLLRISHGWYELVLSHLYRHVHFHSLQQGIVTLSSLLSKPMQKHSPRPILHEIRSMELMFNLAHVDPATAFLPGASRGFELSPQDIHDYLVFWALLQKTLPSMIGLESLTVVYAYGDKYALSRFTQRASCLPPTLKFVHWRDTNMGDPWDPQFWEDDPESDRESEDESKKKSSSPQLSWSGTNGVHLAPWKLSDWRGQLTSFTHVRYFKLTTPGSLPTPFYDHSQTPLESVKIVHSFGISVRRRACESLPLVSVSQRLGDLWRAQTFTAAEMAAMEKLENDIIAELENS